LEENESLRLLNLLTIREEFVFSLAKIKSIKGLKNDFVNRFVKSKVEIWDSFIMAKLVAR
jgi:hypothetical protein